MRSGYLLVVKDALGFPLEVDEASLSRAYVSWLVNHAWHDIRRKVVTHCGIKVVHFQIGLAHILGQFFHTGILDVVYFLQVHHVEQAASLETSFGPRGGPTW